MFMKKDGSVRKSVFVSAALLGVALTALSCGGSNGGSADGSAAPGTAGRAVKTEEIIVGTGNGYEPYCYLDADGNLSGYELAVLGEVDRRLPQYTFKFEVYDCANILVSLTSGKIDIGAHQFEENTDRRATYLYGTEGYNSFDGFLSVRDGGLYSGIASIDELAGNPGAVIPVGQGSNYEAYVKNYNATHDKKLSFEVYGGYEVLLTNLISGVYAGFIAPLPDLHRLNEFTPGLNLKPVSDDPIIVSQTYYIFNKNNATLQQAVDGALGEMKADGTLERLHAEIVESYFNAQGR
jgi:L-cystine transport system substrate-binding protein